MGLQMVSYSLRLNFFKKTDLFISSEKNVFLDFNRE
jgi:hypothetical protein